MNSNSFLLVILPVVFAVSGFLVGRYTGKGLKKTTRHDERLEKFAELLLFPLTSLLDLDNNLKTILEILKSDPLVSHCAIFRLSAKGMSELTSNPKEGVQIPADDKSKQFLDQIQRDLSHGMGQEDSVDYGKDNQVFRFLTEACGVKKSRQARIYPLTGNFLGYQYVFIVFYQTPAGNRELDKTVRLALRLVYLMIYSREMSSRLKDNQEFLDGIFYKNPIAMCLTDESGNIDRPNRSFSQYFPQGLEKIQKVIDPNSFELLMSQQPLDKEFSYNEKIFRVRGTPLYSMAGGIRGAAFILWDDTLQHTLYKKLETSEERYRRLLKELPVGLAIVDQEGRINLVNDHFLMTTGLSDIEQLHGKLLQNLFDIPYGEFKDIAAKVDDQNTMLYQFQYRDGAARKIFSVSLQRIFLGEEEFIEAVFQDVSLENKLYLQLQEKTQQIQEEMATARRIWEHILSIPPLYTSLIRVETFFKPSSQLGGDFYDVIQIDDAHIGFIIADVSGHGVSASLITAMLKMLIEFAPKDPHRLDDMVGYLNHVLVKILPEDEFITLFYGIIDTQNYTLEYINCGHPFPFIYNEKDKTVQVLEGTMFPLGTKRNVSYSGAIKRISIPRNCRIFLYTDGLMTYRKNGTQVRQADLMEIFLQSVSVRRYDILNEIYIRVLRNATQFTEDDVSMLMLVLNKEQAYKKSLSIPSNVLEIDNAIVRILESLAKLINFDEDEHWKLYTSLYEAIINAVEHGNKFNVQKRVTIIYRIVGNLVIFRIRDEGSGFSHETLPNPLDDSNILKPSGRGVYMVRKMMHRVKYNKFGNEITMFMKVENPEKLDE